MKKFLLPMLLAFAIIIPAIQVQAAYVYVPNFYNMAPNRTKERIRMTGHEQRTHNGVNYTQWSYTCLDGNGGIYIRNYLNKIQRKAHFQLVGQNGGNYYFAYTGNQAHMLKKFSGGFHVHVGVSGNNVVVNMVAGMYPEP